MYVPIAIKIAIPPLTATSLLTLMSFFRMWPPLSLKHFAILTFAAILVEHNDKLTFKSKSLHLCQLKIGPFL